MVDVFIGKLAYAYLEVLETYGNTLLPKEKKKLVKSWKKNGLIDDQWKDTFIFVSALHLAWII